MLMTNKEIILILSELYSCSAIVLNLFYSLSQFHIKFYTQVLRYPFINDSDSIIVQYFVSKRLKKKEKFYPPMHAL